MNECSMKNISCLVLTELFRQHKKYLDQTLSIYSKIKTILMLTKINFTEP